MNRDNLALAAVLTVCVLAVLAFSAAWFAVLALVEAVAG